VIADPALPQLRLLLDPDAMAPLLERSLARPARLSGLRVARVSYKPGERMTVHYTAEVDGAAEDAVARAIAGRDLEPRVREPRLVELADRVDGRSPAAHPLVYEPDARALVSWLPFDSRLPALSALRGRLLSYRPGRRAVLRRDDLVLKLYGSEGRYRAAAGALVAASALRGLPSPPPGAFVARLRMTTQDAVDGAPVSALDAAAEAGALLRRLRRARPRALAPAHERPVEAAARKAELITAVLPSLERRVDALLRRLAREEPPASRPVPAHGDFHAGQLLRANGRLVVVDLDGLCLAAPALDLAEYAAAAGDDRGAVLDALVEGYGARPDGLDWHLATAVLIRASHPFHRQLPDWPERVEEQVETAETVLAGGAR
jgi:hypothetical protein